MSSALRFVTIALVLGFGVALFWPDASPQPTPTIDAEGVETTTVVPEGADSTIVDRTRVDAPTPAPEADASSTDSARPSVELRGRVVDADGVGIAAATVAPFKRLTERCSTDGDGYFVISNLDPRRKRHWLEASKKGFVSAGALAQLGDDEPVEIILVPGATVRGIVYGPSREPVPGAQVFTHSGKVKSQTVDATDREGRFELHGLPSGFRLLTTIHDRYPAAESEVRVPEPGESVDVVIELERGRDLRGLIVDADGRPVANATVDARCDSIKQRRDPLRRTQSDENGAFTLHELPLDDIWLHCSADGFAPHPRIDVDITETDVRIALEPTARIAGTVLDGITGRPVPEFRVAIVDVRRPDQSEGGGKNRFQGGGLRKLEPLDVEDENGHFDSGDMPLRPGLTVALEISADGYATTTARDVVARVDATPDDLIVRLVAGVRVYGTVVSQDGQPLEDADVRIARGDAPRDQKGGPRGARTRTDELGRFEVDGQPAGTAHIVVEHEDAGIHVQPTEIPATTRDWLVDVRVAGRGSIRGFVRDATGQPAVAEAVRLTVLSVPGLGRRNWSTKTDDRGRFGFDQLPFGTYRVMHLQEIVGKPLPVRTVDVSVASREPVEVDVAAVEGNTIDGSILTDATIGESSVVALEPIADDEERAATRYARTRGAAFAFRGVTPGRYRLTAWFQDDSGEWHTGSTDADVADGLATRVTVRVD